MSLPSLALGLALGAAGYHVARWWLERRRMARVLRRVLDTLEAQDAERRRLAADFAALSGRRVVFEDRAAIAELRQWQVVPGPTEVN